MCRECGGGVPESRAVLLCNPCDATQQRAYRARRREQQGLPPKPKGRQLQLRAASSSEDQLELLRGWCTVSEDGCWLWSGDVTYNGYGRVGFYDEVLGSRKWFTHRLAFRLANGYLPKTVHHKCANRLCCNPGHLQDVTRQENMAEMFERQALKARIAELEAENAELRRQLSTRAKQTRPKKFKNL